MSQPEATASAGQTATPLKGATLPRVIAVSGILLSGGGAGWLLTSENAPDVGSNKGFEIALVSAAELAAAVATLDATLAAGVVGEAKSCRAPLAFVTLSKGQDGAGGLIRIRSGGYLSPAFRVTDAPQRIAFPLPAPYAAGQGQISVEGQTAGARLTLFPAWSAGNDSGASVVNLVWRTDRPCGA